MIRDADGALQKQVGVLFEAGTLGGWGDGALLDRFASGRDSASEAAFETLVERHGPMVLRVCRAGLGDEHEAHDAFQAVFLVLARKARTVRIRETIGPWLHGVAWRVASRARASGLRRRRHERRAAEMAARSFEPKVGDDAESALHEEVRRLPEAFRAAVVLCDLEGLTTDGAAERLGVPVGTVRSRLYRGRDRLRGRLIRRGIAPAAVGAVVAVPALAVTMTVPSALAEATVRLAVGCLWAGAVPVRLAVLMHGGRHVMGIKGMAAVGLSLGLVAGVGGLAAQGPGGGRSEGKPSAEGRPGAGAVPVAVAKEDASPKSDRGRLQGRWSVARARADDADLPRDHPVYSANIVFRGDEIVVEPDRGGGGAPGTFQIVDDVRPKGFIIAYPGPRARANPMAQTSWTTFEFEGDDRLKLRTTSFPTAGYGLPGHKTPALLLDLARVPDVPVSTRIEDAPSTTDDRPAADPAADRERLQGRWTVVSAKVNGREARERNFLLDTFRFRGNQVDFAPRVHGAHQSYSFMIDPDAQPRALLVAPIAPAAGVDRPQWWIYAFEGNKLRIALDESTKRAGRPRGFDEVDAKHPITVFELIRDERPEEATTTRAESTVIPPPSEPIQAGPSPGRRPADGPELTRAEPGAPAADPAAPGTKPDGRGPDVATDRDRLQGTWSVIKVTIGGEEADGPNMLLAPMTFRGDTVEFGPFGSPPQKNLYRYRIDPEGEPRALRVVPEGRGDRKPRWWLFERKGEKLRTAAWLSLDDTRRPKGFDATDPLGTLVVLELVRDPEPETPRIQEPVEPSQAIERRVPDLAPSALPPPGRPAGDPPSEPRAEPEALEPALAPTSAVAPAAGPIDLPVPAASAPTAAPAPAPLPTPVRASAGPADDLRRLQGTWTILAQEENGQETEPNADSTLLIAGNALVVVLGGQGSRG